MMNTEMNRNLQSVLLHDPGTHSVILLSWLQHTISEAVLRWRTIAPGFSLHNDSPNAANCLWNKDFFFTLSLSCFVILKPSMRVDAVGFMPEINIYQTLHSSISDHCWNQCFLLVNTENGISIPLTHDNSYYKIIYKT